MEWSNPLDEKAIFIQNEILNSTLAAAFRRANVFVEEGERHDDFGKKKEVLRNIIKKYLIGLGNPYKRDVDHLKRITDLKELIDKAAEGQGILRDDQITIGVAQKLVNLYLKYLWCLGVIDEPPHCPVDRAVLSWVKWKGPSWTKKEFGAPEYRDAIALCRDNAEPSLSRWELKKFNDENLSYLRSVNNGLGTS